MKRLQCARRILYSVLVLSLVSSVFLGTALSSSFGKADYTTLMIILSPDNMEMASDISDLHPGEYYFVISNRTRKDADLVLSSGESTLKDIEISQGESGRFKIQLGPGEYTFSLTNIQIPDFSLTIPDSQ